MIEGERISLVKPSMKLVSQVQDAIFESRSELGRYLKWVDLSLENPTDNMRAAVENYESSSNELRHYIVDNVSSEILGAIGLLVRDTEVPFFEIGYWAKTSCAGCGYITEAVFLIEAYAFNELGAKRLEIRTAKCNLASRAVALRCGYVLEAELRNERRLPSGELTDTIVYGKYGL